MSKKTGAAGVSLAVETVLAKFYPSGIATKVLRKQLEDSGFTAKEISNGVYKLTSGGIVERDKEDDCFYLVNDPRAAAPQNRPADVVLPPPIVTPKPLPVTPAPVAPSVTVTNVMEPAVLSNAERDALEFVNHPSQPLDPALQALADLATSTLG